MATRLHSHGIFAASAAGLVLCVGIVFFGIRRDPAERSTVPVIASTSLLPTNGAADRLKQAENAPKMAIELSDAELMQKLRTTVDANPALALQLAQESELHYGASHFAEEREFLRVRAQINLQDIATARLCAERFYRRYPDSPYTERVYRLTGMHPAMPHASANR